ncbi:MAG: PQQ-binding-like beta-propeller repeat protein, partial [Gemmatimonadales bacterium]|nr:PQQ-binding-like beta-propeller repeat protein [Gemmatimonadales bacterium]
VDPDGLLFAINPDGSEKWVCPTGGPGRGTPPAIGADGTLYLLGSVDAVRPDGVKKKWEFRGSSTVQGPPSIGADGTLYVSCSYSLYALYMDGTEKWRFEPDGSGSLTGSPAIGADGALYVGSTDGDLYAINPDGTDRWRFQAGGALYSAPAIGPDGTIYVGSDDANLYAIDPDGIEKWHFQTDGWVRSSPAIGADGTVYVGSDDCALYAINPDGTEKWHLQTGDWVRSSPAIAADGTVYVSSYDDNLYAVNGESGGLAESSWPMFRHDLGRTASLAPVAHMAPTADLANPMSGGSIDSSVLNARGYIDVTFISTSGSALNTASIMDSGAEFYLLGDAVDGVQVDGTPLLLTGSTYRYTFTGSFGAGSAEVHYWPKSWSDNAGNRNAAELEEFTVRYSGEPGSMRWYFEPRLYYSYVTSSPAVGPDGAVYVGFHDDRLYAINPDGSESWYFQTGNGIDHTSPAIAADGTVYVGSHDNNLYAIYPDGTEKWC